MEDITTTEERKEVQNCESCNNSTDNNDKAANETQPVFIETINNKIKTSETVAAVVKEAQPTTTTLDAIPEEEDGKEYDSLPHLDEVATGTTTSTLPSPDEVSHQSDEVETTSLSPPIQNEMEVEKTPEPRPGSALFTPNVKVEENESIVVISSGSDGGGSMEVDSQTEEEDPSATSPNKSLSAELQVLGGNSSSFIEMKNEEAIQKADEEQNYQNGESHVIEKHSDASCADTMTTMADMVPQGSDATTSINYHKGEVSSSMRSRGWLLSLFALLILIFKRERERERVVHFLSLSCVCVCVLGLGLGLGLGFKIVHTSCLCVAHWCSCLLFAAVMAVITIPCVNGFWLISLKVKNEEDSKAVTVVNEGNGTKCPVQIQNSYDNGIAQSVSIDPMVVEPSQDEHFSSTQFEPEVEVSNGATNLESHLQQTSPEISSSIPAAKEEESIDEAPNVGEDDCLLACVEEMGENIFSSFFCDK